MSGVRWVRVSLVLSLFGTASCEVGSPDAAAGDDDAETGDSPGIEIEYIAHAAFLLTAPDGTELLIDPYASRVWLGYDWPSEITPDAVLITHPHYDHDAGRYRQMPFPWPASVPVVDVPGTYAFGDFTVTGVRGKHADPYGMEFGQLNTLWMIEAAGLRVAHLGDNGPLTPAMVTALGRVDVLMMPADGVDHILSRETTAEVLAALDPRVMIPMHYRLADLESDPESPSDLGEIGPWLEGRAGIRHLGGHVTTLTFERLPPSREILVFRHAPYVSGPGA